MPKAVYRHASQYRHTKTWWPQLNAEVSSTMRKAPHTHNRLCRRGAGNYRQGGAGIRRGAGRPGHSGAESYRQSHTHAVCKLLPRSRQVPQAEGKEPIQKIADWFGEGNTVDLLNDLTQNEFETRLKNVPGLADLVNSLHRDQDAPTKILLMEFALHGLAEYSLISKHNLTAGLQFKDLLSGMFTLPKPGEDDEDDDDEIANGKFLISIFAGSPDCRRDFHLSFYRLS